MSELLILPMLMHIAWMSLLYVMLTVVRAPKVWGVGANSDGSNPFARLEPKISANLRNQFEWPILFYAICILIIAQPDYYQATYLWFAWFFIIGRIIHSCIQVFTNNIRLRGLTFTINFIAVIGMWLLLGVDVLSESSY